MRLTRLTGLLLPFGGASGSSGASAVPAPAARDRAILKVIAGLLGGTGQFGAVTTWGPPDEVGVSSEYAALAGLELAGFAEEPPDDGAAGGDVLRTVDYALHLYARGPDPDARDDELDRLGAVASDAVDGVSYGGHTLPAYSALVRGRYGPGDSAERRLTVEGQFAYLIPGWQARDTDP